MRCDICGGISRLGVWPRSMGSPGLTTCHECTQQVNAKLMVRVGNYVELVKKNLVVFTEAVDACVVDLIEARRVAAFAKGPEAIRVWIDEASTPENREKRKTVAYAALWGSSSEKIHQFQLDCSTTFRFPPAEKLAEWASQIVAKNKGMPKTDATNWAHVFASVSYPSAVSEQASIFHKVRDEILDRAQQVPIGGRFIHPIFGSPTRCCECDGDKDVHQAQEGTTMYPAFYCGVHGCGALDPKVKDGDYKSIAESILQARKRRGLPDPYAVVDGKCKHGHVGYCGFCATGTEPSVPSMSPAKPTFVLGGTQRWTPIHGAVSATLGLKFYGQLGDEDVWLSETFTKTPIDWRPTAHFCAITEDGTSIGRHVVWSTDLLVLVDTPDFSLALAAKEFVNQLGGRAKMSERAQAEWDHRGREAEVCVGCGKPSTNWLDDGETVRVCDECDDLVPLPENGEIISAADAAVWVKRLRDPYARHTLWEKRAGAFRGALLVTGDDPLGREHAELVWKERVYRAEIRLDTALTADALAQHAREFPKYKSLRTLAEARCANELVNLPLGLDLFDPRKR